MEEEGDVIHVPQPCRSEPGAAQVTISRPTTTRRLLRRVSSTPVPLFPTAAYTQTPIIITSGEREPEEQRRRQDEEAEEEEEEEREQAAEGQRQGQQRREEAARTPTPPSPAAALSSDAGNTRTRKERKPSRPCPASDGSTKGSSSAADVPPSPAVDVLLQIRMWLTGPLPDAPDAQYRLGKSHPAQGARLLRDLNASITAPSRGGKRDKVAEEHQRRHYTLLFARHWWMPSAKGIKYLLEERNLPVPSLEVIDSLVERALRTPHAPLVACAPFSGPLDSTEPVFMPRSKVRRYEAAKAADRKLAALERETEHRKEQLLRYKARVAVDGDSASSTSSSTSQRQAPKAKRRRTGERASTPQDQPSEGK